MRPADCIDCAASVTDFRLTPTTYERNSCAGFASGPIVHPHEPPAHSLFRRVHRIARERLPDLRKQGLRSTYEQIAHVLAVLEFILEQLDRTAHRIAFELHNASMNETRLYVAAKRPNAPSRPILAVSIAAPFSRTVNSDRTEPRGK
jgi:hypothetical protein